MRTFMLMPGRSGDDSGESRPTGKPGRWRSARKGPFRILLASGNAKERAAWRGMLDDPNHVFTEVENGAAALKVMLIDEADLVIAAVSMAKLDALELLRAARDIKHSAPIVVVALGHSEINHVYLKTARLLGAAATYMQPFETAEFVDGIQAMLKVRKER